MPSRVPSEKCGHVFILHCDSAGLAADALLVPNASIEQHLRDAGLRDGKTHVFEAAPLKGPSDEQIAEAAVALVRKFFETAAAVVTKSVFRRDNPLFALPLYGAGKTDQSDQIKKEALFIEAMLPIMYDVADTYAIDVALCTTSTSAYKVMQVRRAPLCPFAGGPFWMLSSNLRQESDRLAALAERGALSIFFGAGVSYPSGLPSWGGLLKSLAVKAGFSEEEQEALADLDYLDQPTLIEERMGTEKFRPAIAEAVSGGQYTPAHSILRELRVPSATTNYDDLFEQSSPGGTVYRLPWDSNLVSQEGKGPAGYVAKLHGCVSHPKSIVLTRKDYLRYGDVRQALRGLIHEMLLSTNILFIGFSMTDTNLHLIIDDVRQCLEDKQGSDPEGVFGTILSLRENEMFRKLWDQDFNVTTFGKSWGDRPAWFHDCFLDRLGMKVASTEARSSFVLNGNFARLLSKQELRIKQALLPVLELAKDEAVRDSPAWAKLAELLERLGANVSK